MKIYFVNVFRFKSEQQKYEDMRCWGWYQKEEDALDVIQKNFSDIYERGHYNYALIEPMEEGICYRGEGERWFKVEYVDPDSDVYSVVETSKPVSLKNIVGFSYA
jgi:hypothetical protein